MGLQSRTQPGKLPALGNPTVNRCGTSAYGRLSHPIFFNTLLPCRHFNGRPYPSSRRWLRVMADASHIT